MKNTIKTTAALLIFIILSAFIPVYISAEEPLPKNETELSDQTTLSVTVSRNGSIDVKNCLSSSQTGNLFLYTFKKGTTATISIYPDKGCVFDSATIDGGAPVQIIAALFDIVMDKNHTAIVNFTAPGSKTLEFGFEFGINASESNPKIKINEKIVGKVADIIPSDTNKLEVVLPIGYVATELSLTFENGAQTIVVPLVNNACVIPALAANASAKIKIARTNGIIIRTDVKGNGKVSINNPQPSPGDSITFSVIPDEGNIVEYAKLNGTIVKLNNNTYIAIASADLIFEVSFIPTPKAKAVNISVNPQTNNGRISFADGDGTTRDIDYGKAVEIIFTPDEGYQVDRVSINNISTDSIKDNKIVLVVTQELNVVVTFKRVTFRITAVVVKDFGGKITAVGHEMINGIITVEYGEDLTLAFTPDMGHDVSAIKINGTLIKLENKKEYTFKNIKSANTISVKFVTEGEDSISYRISVNCGANGKVSPTGNHDVDDGEDVVYEFIPDDGYEIDKVLLDGAPAVITDNKIVLINVKSSHLIAVTFKRSSGNVENALTINDVDWNSEKIIIDTSKKYKIEKAVFEKINKDCAGKTIIFKNDIFWITLQADAKFQVINDYTNMSFGTNISSAESLAFSAAITKNNITSHYSILVPSSVFPSGSTMEINLGSDFSSKTITAYSFDGTSLKLEKSNVIADISGRITLSLFDVRTMVFVIDSSAPTNHIVTINVGANGAASPSETETVPHGGELVVKIVPFDGYMISKVTVNDKEVVIDEETKSKGKCELPITNITQDTTVDIKFSLMPVNTNSKLGVIFAIVIISIALVGGGVLFYIRWKQTKY